MNTQIILYEACSIGNLELVKLCVENGADITAEYNYAIRWAAYYGHLDVVIYLHKNGADITAEDNYALMWAAEKGHLDVVKYIKSLEL